MESNFSNLSTEKIAEILQIAMDDGEWHSPSVSDINIHTQHQQAIYGWCNISKHNTYHDKEVWFNINANTVQIWEAEYRKGKSNLKRYRAIYNLKRLSEIISELTFNSRVFVNSEQAEIPNEAAQQRPQPPADQREVYEAVSVEDELPAETMDAIPVICVWRHTMARYLGDKKWSVDSAYPVTHWLKKVTIPAAALQSNPEK